MHPVLLSFFLFFCLNAKAAQYPGSNGGAHMSRSTSSAFSASALNTGMIETILTPYENGQSRFLQFLNQAKSRCYIASYSITAPSIINKLINLHCRGVDVQVITDRTQSSGRNEKAALAALRANDISVFAGKSIDNALMHCKFCVIDGHLVEDGSFNYTNSASREDNILNFVDSQQRAAQFLVYWFRIKKDLR